MFALNDGDFRSTFPQTCVLLIFLAEYFNHFQFIKTRNSYFHTVTVSLGQTSLSLRHHAYIRWSSLLKRVFSIILQYGLVCFLVFVLTDDTNDVCVFVLFFFFEGGDVVQTVEGEPAGRHQEQGRNPASAGLSSSRPPRSQRAAESRSQDATAESQGEGRQ